MFKGMIKYGLMPALAVSVLGAVGPSIAEAATSVKVQAVNGSTAASSNQLYPQFKVINNGTTSLNLADLKLRYYFTADGVQAQTFSSDWAAKGSTAIATSNVTGKFVAFSPVSNGADTYLEVGFSSSAGSLAPGQTVDVQTRVNKSDWSNYTQSNDYSFNASATSLVDWSKVTAYVSGTLSWGTAPSSGGTSTPTPTPTPPAPTPTPPTSTPAPTPTPATGALNDRYYPAGTSADSMKAMAKNMTKSQVKGLLISQVDEHWSVIQSKFGFKQKVHAYAFFIGQATRESTLDASLETGVDSAHSYGPLQTAETAFANANPNYMKENVPELFQYDFTPQNFYDPGISTHLGIRKMIHFSNLARASYTGKDVLRYSLIGFNTGWISGSPEEWVKQYSDEIAALAGWYLNNGHLYDNVWTWTNDPKVDRSNPWSWY
ncbi:Cellulose binding domain-containing protein [Paenibacillaceae bacterium GAS479]|nr:Cellulose binding domain-containing protein [Paenibacillaceae bacterium GAS479]